MYFRLQVIHKSHRQVLTQVFSAPFKAGNSRQVQTCYISREYNTKKTQHLTGSILLGEMGVLMTLNHRASTLQCSPLKLRFLFGRNLSLGICRSFVIQCHYHTSLFYTEQLISTVKSFYSTKCVILSLVKSLECKL